MAKLIMVSGEVIEVTPENGSDFTLQELYDHIGCTCVERLPLLGNKWMWLDEEGKITGKPLNSSACAYYSLNKCTGFRDDYIVGNVLICKSLEVL